MAWYEDIIGMKSRMALAEPENEHVHIAALPASAVAVEQPPAAPPAPPKEPVPIPAASIESVPEMDDQLRQQYIAVVEELGISQPGLLRDAARAWFRDRGTRLYDAKKVHAFLTDQYGNEHTPDQQSTHAPRRLATWGWRPLRQVDSSQPSQPWNFWPYSNGEIWNGAQPYTKAIPLPVLLTARDLVAEFPTARLFVSDELNMDELRPVDDPFLLVLIDGQAFIIERWDEPAYRE